MNTKKSLNLCGFLAANPMTKYSDCAWSEAASNNNLGANTTAYLSAGELNLMSRFSLNSSLVLHSVNDLDATSSSTSSSSATNNSSNSLSVSPAIERDTRPIIRATIQASNHLLELQKEIKEEEEEIFADINSLINRRSNLYSALDDDDDDDEDDDEINLDQDDENYSTSNHIKNSNNNIHLRGYQNHMVNERIFSNDSDDLNDYQSHSADDINTLDYQNESGGGEGGGNNNNDQQDLHHFKVTDNDRTIDYMQQNSSQYLQESIESIHEQADHENDPHYMDDEHAFAACDQTDQQLSEQNYQAIQAVIQQVTSNLPKPCVFFLEGNCRRSDCKYSHDLSNITCKYWIEGFCFKGEMCPFLHSYTPPGDSLDSSLLDEEGLKMLAKKQLNPTFAIESEADFPSLPLDAPAATLNDSIKNSLNADAFATTIKNQILSSNPAVLFKTVKKKRKRG